MLMLLMWACAGEPPPPIDDPTTVSSNARMVIDRVKASTDLANIRTEIRMYRTMNDNEPPPSLDVLQLQGLQYPDAYHYDPASGEVTCPDYPGL